MKPKTLLLSNSILFHYSFCSFNKNQLVVTPILLRYLKRNIQIESEHFFIQIQEQKKKRLADIGVLPELHRFSFTRKNLQDLKDFCSKQQFDLIVVEIMTGSPEETMLIKVLQTTEIPIDIYAHSIELDFFENIESHYINSIYSFTDVLKLS